MVLKQSDAETNFVSTVDLKTLPGPMEGDHDNRIPILSCGSLTWHTRLGNLQDSIGKATEIGQSNTMRREFFARISIDLKILLPLKVAVQTLGGVSM